MQTDIQMDRWPDMTKIKLLTNLIFSHTDSPQSLVCVKPYTDFSTKPKKFHTVQNFTTPRTYHFYE
jgi:hypothetical protein